MYPHMITTPDCRSGLISEDLRAVGNSFEDVAGHRASAPDVRLAATFVHSGTKRKAFDAQVLCSSKDSVLPCSKNELGNVNGNSSWPRVADRKSSFLQTAHVRSSKISYEFDGS